MTLKDILKEAKVAKKDAAVDLDATPSKARIGLEMRRNQAVQRVEELQKEYLKAASELLLGIAPEGKPEVVAKYADVAATEGALIMSADKLFVDLAKSIEKAGNSYKVFGIEQLVLLLEAVREKTDKAGLDHVSDVRLTQMYEIQNFAELVAVVKTLVTASLGQEVINLLVKTELLEMAFKAQLDGKVIPVVLTGTVDPSAIGEVYPLGIHPVTLGDEANVTTVLNTFNQINKKLKKLTKQD